MAYTKDLIDAITSVEEVGEVKLGKEYVEGIVLEIWRKRPLEELHLHMTPWEEWFYVENFVEPIISLGNSKTFWENDY